MKLSETVIHTWEICLLPLIKLNWVTRWRRIPRIRKCLLPDYFTLLVVLVLLCRDYIGRDFSVLVHHRETNSARTDIHQRSVPPPPPKAYGLSSSENGWFSCILYRNNDTSSRQIFRAVLVETSICCAKRRTFFSWISYCCLSCCVDILFPHEHMRYIYVSSYVYHTHFLFIQTV
jgi:hypothetical protein